ncbi:hypothetical protein RE432_14995 [Pusillimonas sp. SM2304]|uniref:hypothetical protein n=1 Tax=Pusillimonas sp. SM2304 TaxID=3073241 RepID=UPI002876E99C|nr:hypothetical protein [Pusillimonas sp. SM2304]MDS1141746.1 hypothetical protein [Pusillimonas sp. SM2304]
MDEITHTPGPWVAALYGAFFTEVRAQDSATGRRVAATWVQGQPRSREQLLRQAQQNEANARLIAAAPDFLAVCESWVSYMGSPHAATQEREDKLLDAMRAAIAKAKGLQA